MSPSVEIQVRKAIIDNQSPKEIVSKYGISKSALYRLKDRMKKEANVSEEKKEIRTDDPILRSDAIRYILKHRNGFFISDLARKLAIDPSNALKVVQHLSHHDGYNLVQKNNMWELISELPPMKPLNLKVLLGKEFSFGIVSDPHLCSKYARLDVLEAAYDFYAKEGVDTVLNAGNIIDGEFRFNRYELLAHGAHDQSLYVADHYPQRDGVKTYFVTGTCYDDQTEVLTKEKGFVLFKDLDGTEEVATLNQETKEWEWEKPTEIIDKGYSGEMLHFKTQKVDYMVTPDHMMFYQHREKFTKCLAKDYKKGRNRFYRGCEWVGSSPDEIGIPEVTSKNSWCVKNNQFRFPAKSFMRFLGWYISEGSVWDTCITISQHSPENREEIISTIRELGIEPRIKKYSICFCSIHLSEYLKKLGKCFQKYIPENLKQLDKELLEEFLISYWKGDGHGYGTEGSYAQTTSRKLACDLVEIGMKCGWAARFSTREKTDEKRVICGTLSQGNHDLHSIYLAKNVFPCYGYSPESIQYDGRVYCVRVPNEIILIRRNGKTSWGHNCHEGWYQDREGMKIGWYIQKVCEEQGREDLIHIGHVEQDILLKQKLDTTRIRLMHPGGGTPYALSYPSQKMVESFQGGDKPHVLIMGHYHKFDYNFQREVLCIMPGCIQDQTPFMRKKKLAAHVGFCKVTLGLRIDGTIGRSAVEFLPFYDARYHRKLNEYSLDS